MGSSEVVAQGAADIAVSDTDYCRANPEFAADVARLVGGAAGSQKRLAVRFGRARRGVRVSIAIGGKPTPAQRSVVLPNCEEANQTAVLLCALAIDPNVVLPSAADEPAPSNPAPPSAEPRPAPVDGGPAEGEAPTEQAVTRAAPAAAQPVPPAAVQTQPHGPWFARAAAALDLLALSRPSGVAAIELGFSNGPYELGLGARYAPLRHLSTDVAGTGTLEASFGSGTLRAGYRVPFGKFTWTSAVGMSFTALTARVDGVTPSHTRRAFIPEPALQALLAVPAARPLMLELGVEVRFLLRRPQLTVDGVLRYELPAVAAQFMLGVRFWSLLRGPGRQ